jgi:hypothetical protein
MKFVWTLSLLLLSRSFSAQTHAQQDVTQALHCLKTEHGGCLDASLLARPRLRINVTQKRTSSPDTTRFVILVLESRSKGQIFDLVRTSQHAEANWKIKNNGNFEVTKSGIEFVDVLGGVWTQEDLERNVKQALRRKTLLVDLRNLDTKKSGVVCSCYADQ